MFSHWRKIVTFFHSGLRGEPHKRYFSCNVCSKNKTIRTDSAREAQKRHFHTPTLDVDLLDPHPKKQNFWGQILTKKGGEAPPLPQFFFVKIFKNMKFRTGFARETNSKTSFSSPTVGYRPPNPPPRRDDFCTFFTDHRKNS